MSIYISIQKIVLIKVFFPLFNGVEFPKLKAFPKPLNSVLNELFVYHLDEYHMLIIINLI